MKRFLMVFILIVALSTILPKDVLSAERISVTLNNNNVTFDVPPVIDNGHILVPMRNICEGLGAEILWDGDTKSITAIKGKKLIRLTINNKTAYQNNIPIELDVPAKIVNGRTMVPIRFISEAFGATVEWDNDKKTVSIDDHTELKQKAVEQVENYFSLLNKAFRGEVDSIEWEGIISKDVLNNGDESKAIYLPVINNDIPLLGAQITDVEIIDVSMVPNKSKKNLNEVEVTVFYTFINPTEHEISLQKRQYEKMYHLKYEYGNLVINSEQINRVSNADSIPLKNLKPQEIFQIEQEFNRNNEYTYEFIHEFNDQFITSVLSPIFGILKWGDQNEPSVRKNLEQLYSNFDPSVFESTGWQDFVNLDAKREPTFFVLESFSSHNHISAIVAADLFPGFYFQPAILEIEFEKLNNEWIIKRIDNVREYKNLQNLKNQEPETYNSLVNIENYRLFVFGE